MTDRKWYDEPGAGMRLINAYTHGEDYETEVSVSGDEETDKGRYYRWLSENANGMYLVRERIAIESGDEAVLHMQKKFGLSRSCSKAYIIYEAMVIRREKGYVRFRTPLRRECVVKWTDGSYSRLHFDKFRNASKMLPYNLRPGREQSL